MSAGGLAPAFKPLKMTASGPTRLKPKPLHQGDTIGLVSPASIVGDDEAYDDVVETIKQLGYKIKEGANARKKYGYFAGTDEQRAADLNAMFFDPEVDAIMPFRGGWGSNRILDFIEFDLIRNHPKILVGFSDITSLLLAIYAKTGLITFHGPVAKSIWTRFTMKHFRKMLDATTLASITTHTVEFSKDYRSISTIRPGKATGSLLGGNLSVLTAMIGSDYLPDWKNSILFLEDVGEDIYRIDRMLTQLKISGILDQLSGFIFGQCTNCDVSEKHKFTLEQILDHHIKPLEIPAFTGALFGHIDHMVTLPVGAKTKIDAESGIITLSEGVVSYQSR